METDPTIKRFREKYYDKNSISGLNQKDFKTFVLMVNDIESFILSELQQEREKIKEFIAGNWYHENKKDVIEVQKLLNYLK